MAVEYRNLMEDIVMQNLDVVMTAGGRLHLRRL